MFYMSWNILLLNLQYEILRSTIVAPSTCTSWKIDWSNLLFASNCINQSISVIRRMALKRGPRKWNLHCITGTGIKKLKINRCCFMQTMITIEIDKACFTMTNLLMISVIDFHYWNRPSMLIHDVDHHICPSSSQASRTQHITTLFKRSTQHQRSDALRA